MFNTNAEELNNWITESGWEIACDECGETLHDASRQDLLSSLVLLGWAVYEDEEEFNSVYCPECYKKATGQTSSPRYKKVVGMLPDHSTAINAISLNLLETIQYELLVGDEGTELLDTVIKYLGHVVSMDEVLRVLYPESVRDSLRYGDTLRMIILNSLYIVDWEAIRTLLEAKVPERLYL